MKASVNSAKINVVKHVSFCDTCLATFHIEYGYDPKRDELAMCRVKRG